MFGDFYFEYDDEEDHNTGQSNTGSIEQCRLYVWRFYYEYEDEDDNNSDDDDTSMSKASITGEGGRGGLDVC